MTCEQEQAATQLLRALNKCHQAGLQGGVYDQAFCLWPRSIDPHAVEDFFGTVEERGRILETRMLLDGGAGR